MDTLELQLTPDSLMALDTASKFRSDLDEEIELYHRAGLEKKAKALVLKKKLLTIAGVLEARGMALLSVPHRYDKTYTDVMLLGSDGKRHFLNEKTYSSRFEREKMSKYTGNIPREILERLPENAAHKAYVFREGSDPVIAVKLNFSFLDRFKKTGYYVAIFKWE